MQETFQPFKRIRQTARRSSFNYTFTSFLQRYTSVSSCIILGALKCILGHFWATGERILASRIAPLFAHIALFHIPFFYSNEVLRNKYNKSIYVRRVANTSMTTGRWHSPVQQLKVPFSSPRANGKNIIPHFSEQSSRLALHLSELLMTVYQL